MNAIVAATVRATLLLSLIAAAACERRPVVFEFAHGGQPGAPRYAAATYDAATIEAVRAELAKPIEQRSRPISGRIDWGDGGVMAG